MIHDSSVFSDLRNFLLAGWLKNTPDATMVVPLVLAAGPLLVVPRSAGHL